MLFTSGAAASQKPRSHRIHRYVVGCRNQGTWAGMLGVLGKAEVCADSTSSFNPCVRSENRAGVRKGTKNHRDAAPSPEPNRMRGKVCMTREGLRGQAYNMFVLYNNICVHCWLTVTTMHRDRYDASHSWSINGSLWMTISTIHTGPSLAFCPWIVYNQATEIGYNLCMISPPPQQTYRLSWMEPEL